MQNLQKKSTHQIINYLATIIVVSLVIVIDIPHLVDQYFNKSIVSNALAIILFFAIHYSIQLILDIIIIVRFDKVNFKTIIQQYVKATYIQMFYVIAIMLISLWASIKVAPWFALIIMAAAMSLQISFQKYWLKLQQGLFLRKLDLQLLNEILKPQNLKSPEILIANTNNTLIKWVGEIFKPQLIISNNILQDLDAEAFKELVIHQLAVVKLKSRKRAIRLAYLHNLLILAISIYLVELPFTSAGAIITAVAYYSLISAITILPLNKLAQNAIHEQDVYAIDNLVTKHQLQSIINRTEQQHKYSPLYPYLSVEDRIHYIEKYEDNPWGAYQITQIANYMSWSMGNLMAKSMPFNVAQPNNWI